MSCIPYKWSASTCKKKSYPIDIELYIINKRQNEWDQCTNNKRFEINPNVSKSCIFMNK